MCDNWLKYSVPTTWKTEHSATIYTQPFMILNIIEYNTHTHTLSNIYIKNINKIFRIWCNTMFFTWLNYLFEFSNRRKRSERDRKLVQFFFYLVFNAHKRKEIDRKLSFFSERSVPSKNRWKTIYHRQMFYNSYYTNYNAKEN